MTLNQLRYAITVAGSNSMNEAAKSLFVSQPSLSAAIRELEEEVGCEIFFRTNRGISVTPEGKVFLGYARQVVEQYALLEDRYISKNNIRGRFSVSMQHYTFAVNAFVELTQQYDLEQYDFSLSETKTSEVIDHVKNFRSELGVLYRSDFNRAVLDKIFHDQGLEFLPLFECNIYAYLCKSHPLAGKKKVTLEELAEYPCVAFDQGENNSFYYAEEPFSTYPYKKVIHVSDRATILNLFVGVNGFTLCSGIICEDLNGKDYCAIRVDTRDRMEIGVIKRKDIPLSTMGSQYIEALSKYKEKRLK